MNGTVKRVLRRVKPQIDKAARYLTRAAEHLPPKWQIIADVINNNGDIELTAKLLPAVHWSPFVPAENKPDGFQLGYVNSQYTVWVKHFHNEYMGADMLWLSIKTNAKDPKHDWRDLQRIKNELAGTTCEAFELYPATTRLVDTSNQYHLWVLPPTQSIPVGWNDRDVIQDQAACNKEFNGAKQRAIADHHQDEGLPEVGLAWLEFQNKSEK